MVQTPFDRILIAVGDAGDPWADVGTVSDELSGPTPSEDELIRLLEAATNKGYLAQSTHGTYKLTGTSIRLLYR
jgi:hypothetical protein